MAVEHEANAFRCNLCPRRCNALRTVTEGLGFCGMPSQPRLARAALHQWEEPPVSGTRGSGAVFFSGCTLRCVFCQNEPISHLGQGKTISVSRLREIFAELIDQGAHNINLVSPTPYAPVISQALEQPVGVPVVWNTGGYERVETLRALEGKVDVYLPDLKYLDLEKAARYSGAADYPQRATEAILEMYRQVGPVQLDENGLIRRGLIIRHLILPGQVREARAVMDWVSEQFPPGAVLFSLMSQYVPLGRAAEFPEIDRPLRKGEAKSAAEYMANLGLSGFVQERDAASARYVPSFDLTGV
ncbi:MAG: radical SAM protein [Clostridiales bacterium]|nr:radical SAM protein [Clostridiales bacterium]